MRKKILFIIIACLASCTTIHQLNTNMEEANVVMSQNIEAIQASKAAIEENTRQIERSTDTMQRFAYLFPIGFFLSLLAFAYIVKRLKLFKNKEP